MSIIQLCVLLIPSALCLYQAISLDRLSKQLKKQQEDHRNYLETLKKVLNIDNLVMMTYKKLGAK
jgi:hypothetical protein